MPTIADLSFRLDDGFECGIAYLLHERPETAVSERYASGHLLASPVSPYAVLRFSGSSSRHDAMAQGTELMHQALDLHSMLGRADLQVRDTRNEFMVWWADSARHHLLLSSTVTFTMKVGPVQAVVHDASGNLIPHVQPTPSHHLGFRFFRLSQVTDDLYDAFRNMYLAFECLLSARHPKTQRQEIQWLTDALTASAHDLQISVVCPTGTSDPVAHILARIYNGARLPLFHAKDGRTYFAPGANHADREVVQDSLTALTSLVLRMAEVWYNARRRGGWASLRYFDEGWRAQLSGSQLVVSDEPTDLKDEVHGAAAAVRGVQFSAVVNEHFDAEKRTNIAADIPVVALAGQTQLAALYVSKDGSPLIGVTPDTIVDVAGFDDVHARIFIRGRNGNQPKSQYTR